MSDPLKESEGQNLLPGTSPSGLPSVPSLASDEFSSITSFVEYAKQLDEREVERLDEVVELQRKIYEIEEDRKDRELRRYLATASTEANIRKIDSETKNTELKAEHSRKIANRSLIYKQLMGVSAFLAGLYLTLNGNLFGSLIMGGGLLSGGVPLQKAAEVMGIYKKALDDEDPQKDKDEEQS